MNRLIALVLTLLCLIMANYTPTKLAALTTAPLVISELQTGGLDATNTEDGRLEFIELYNQTLAELDVTNWKVQYFASSRTDVVDSSSTPTRDLATLNGHIKTSGYILLSYENYLAGADIYFGQGNTATSGLLAKSGGHIRIVDSNGNIVDRTGWGTAKQAEGTKINEIPVGSSAQRLADDSTGILIDTDDNGLDFIVSPNPTPTGGGIYISEPEPEVPTDEENPLPDNELPEESPPVYHHVLITELLPDPASPKLDSEDEFVELFNPNSFDINVTGYILFTGSASSSYKYVLPDLVLKPSEHKALYSRDTKLTLVNTTGYAWITNPDNELVYETYWYQDIGTEKSWALINNEWVVTNKLTPSAVNQAAEAVLSESDSEQISPPVLTPCPSGKYRNPETNRCRNIEEDPAFTACKPGQTRNPATNRCRATTTTGPVLATCKPGQERNPATNRCRSVGSAKTTAACQEGYERNSETNRCRKSTTAKPAVTSTAKTPMDTVTKVNYAVLGSVSALALGYGGYEYRRDVMSLLSRIKSRLKLHTK